ncbi:hypothetical protein [Algoriphagus boritolerans]|uniref:hypothetical protein n=1 Tax=Algoriphagus boritolerans TaxID=308111 RepID=UPI000ACD053B
MKNLLTLLLFFAFTYSSFAKDGYELWLDYDKVEALQMKAQLESLFSGFFLLWRKPNLRCHQKGAGDRRGKDAR